MEWRLFNPSFLLSLTLSLLYSFNPVEPVKITLARKDAQLKQIIALQRANLMDSIDADTASAQGFVTVAHELPVLQAMNAATASVIALRERKLVGYCLAMTRNFRDRVPALASLFARLDGLQYRGSALGEAGYLVMGQLCVAEEARGQKIPDRMYKYLRACYYLRFPYCITSIDARNTRSQRVHARTGFTELDRFTEADGRQWIIVIWNWREGMEGFD